MRRSIEVVLASPPEREELVAQLFHTDGGQWGEVFREKGVYMLELYGTPSGTQQLNCEECLVALDTAIRELKARLEER